MFELPTQPQSIEEIIHGGIKLYVFCLPKILFFIVGIISLAILLHLHFPQSASSTPTAFVETVMDYPLLFMGYTLLILWLQLTIFYRMGTILFDNDVGNSKALQVGLKKLFPLFIATVLYTVIVAIASLLIIPGLFLVISLWFFMPLMLFEQHTIFSAFTKSYRLVQGHWWRTAIIFTFPLFLPFLIGIILQGFLETLLTATVHLEQLNWLIQLSYLVIDKLLTPLFYAIMLIQYHDLKKRHDPLGPPETDLIA